jgi:Bacterial pre-peptidase C-terminal domain
MKHPKILAWIVIAVALFCTASVFSFSYRSPPAELSNRVPSDSLSGSRGSQHLYRITVPSGASNLQFSVYGGHAADAVDLYASFKERPTPAAFDAKSAGPGAAKTIAVRTPEAGTYYVLLHAARGSYSDLSLVASYAPAGSVFKVGMHAHRLYNGGDWDGPASPRPLFKYGLIRDWDISHLQDAAVWKSDGSINFTLIDRVYEGHARHGAKVIKTFGSVPTWASKRPAEPNPQYPNWPGAKSGPRDLDEYEDYVFRFVSREKEFLWAVEGWNEPYACPGDPPTEFTTMTPTELADAQKRVYLATKRVDRRILVLSPAQAYVCGIPTILNARTSENEPMWKFFDALAWHPYNRSAKGDAGPSYAEEVGKVRRHLAHAGLSRMPIIDTEHGWLEPPKEGGKEFHSFSDDQKGQVLYETAQLAKSLGVLAVVWYAYDDQMLGMPMNNPRLSRRLQQIYDDFNTR